MINNKYRLENNKLGVGGFAEVYLGTNIESNENVAIKKISLNKKELRQEQTLEKIQFEIQLMQKLKHPNIVKYMDVVKTISDWYIIMEYCNYGTLSNVIKFNEEMNKKKV